jgi:hypothetical protein
VASIFAAIATLWLVVPTTTGCGGGVCSAEEQGACQSTYDKCVHACGNGTNGLPEADPAYQGCIDKCNGDLCSCQNACGTTCQTK